MAGLKEQEANCFYRYKPSCFCLGPAVLALLSNDEKSLPFAGTAAGVTPGSWLVFQDPSLPPRWGETRGFRLCLRGNLLKTNHVSNSAHCWLFSRSGWLKMSVKTAKGASLLSLTKGLPILGKTPCIRGLALTSGVLCWMCKAYKITST